MKISPNYDAIKARAIALLTAPTGYFGVSSTTDALFYGKYSNNSIGVALIWARDEIEPVTSSRVGKFNVGNHEKAEREINRELRKLLAGPWRERCLLERRRQMELLKLPADQWREREREQREWCQRERDLEERERALQTERRGYPSQVATRK